MADHAALTQALDRGDFEPYIRHVRFPRFKNVADGTRIDFTHPITAIVGPNGTNKTSILRALEGCPNYYNFGNYWFSTTLDPIGMDTRHRFIHGYKVPSGVTVESIKTRIKKKGTSGRQGNPDYFEPSRPLIGDGMQKLPALEDTDPLDLVHRSQTRWNAIDKKVTYLDFRHDIPAYDIYYHFNIAGKKNDIPGKKRLIRARARHIAQSLDGLQSSHALYNTERILDPAVELNKESINWISKILGRKYSRIRVVRHSFYGIEGHTVRLETSGLSYSEAFAGSGEYAAVMLVKSILESPDKSLIILDEPEVSLHPAAQAALMDFLLQSANKKKHQIVISTHSSEIVRHLPPQAIKVLVRDKTSGDVTLLAQSALPNEAFRYTGTPTMTQQIYVEDELAVHIVERAIRSLGAGFTSSIHITPLGGADQIATRHVTSMVEVGSNCLILLDGDRLPKQGRRSVAKIPDSEVLPELMKYGITRSSLGLDGGNASNAAQAIAKGKAVLKWIESHLDYLPGHTPESLLRKMLNEASPRDEAAMEAWSMQSKTEWVKRANEALDYPDGVNASAAEILNRQRVSLGLVPESHPALHLIRASVKLFVERDPE